MKFLGLILLVLCLTAIEAKGHGKHNDFGSKKTSLHGSAELLWEGWKSKYAKSYSGLEERIRFAIFKANMKRCDELNAAHKGSAWFGLNKFSDISPIEFQQQYLNLRLNAEMDEQRDDAPVLPPFQPRDIPVSYNWVDQNKTTPVYNQGMCGSCWTFSVTEQIESMFALKHSSVPASLSMQQIVDCDIGDGDEGCNGGDPRLAYNYIQKTGGLVSYDSYPYTGEDGKCKFNAANVKADINGWSYVTPNTSKNETQMLYYIATTGPASICADAATWQFYIGGIIRTFCGQNLDHAIQLVGYGTETDVLKTEYWIIRNSWGADWGESGFLRVERNKNLCGIADLVTTVSISD